MNTLHFVIILIIIVLIQAFTSMFHIKYYQKKVRTTASKYSQGYLGVGMTKRFFRIGKMAILVTDKEGIIQECNILSGLVIFARFHNYKNYVGEHIDLINWDKKRHRLVVEDAIKRVKEQMTRTERVKQLEATKEELTE